MCWRGLVQHGDKGAPPGASACAEPHYWETFAAAYLPADATTDKDLTTLMSRPDIAALCSADALATHSRDAAATEGWRREAWPIPSDAYTVLVHCLAGSPDGESPGSAFAPVS
jgi:serine/threonine-protein kinase